MTFVTSDDKIREIHSDHPDFYINNGIKLAPRAYIEVSYKCPTNIRLAIDLAVANGYLKAVANVKEKEYIWEQLQK